MEKFAVRSANNWGSSRSADAMNRLNSLAPARNHSAISTRVSLVLFLLLVPSDFKLDIDLAFMRLSLLNLVWTIIETVVNEN